MDVFEICIGDCSEPDLQVWDNGIDSIRCQPLDPVAGTIVSFMYSVENIGEGDAEPPGPFDEGGDLVMHLEVMTNHQSRWQRSWVSLLGQDF